MTIFKYNCEKCVYSTNVKQLYNNHLQSKRHIAQAESAILVFSCKNCKKRFKCHSGLWRHTAKCIKPEIINTEENQPDGTVIQFKDSNEELKSEMKDIKKLLVKLTKNPKPNNTIINNNNIQNNQNYNVNMMLNQNFTQAKNFMEMIDGIQLASDYNEYISSEDYVNNIVNLIKNEMDKLPISQRPLQCIKNEDDNQHILHVRHNNKWNKETELEWTQQIHNYYIDDDDEPDDENKKIIFYAVKQLEENIIAKIQRLYRNTAKLVATNREYKGEMNHVPNKMRIIRLLIEHVNIDRGQLTTLIEEAWDHIQDDDDEDETNEQEDETNQEETKEQEEETNQDIL